MAARPLTQILDSIEQLLDEQHTLVLDGEADALPRLSSQLTAALGLLLSYAGSREIQAQRARIERIQARARGVGTVLSRRQSSVQGSLEALGGQQARFSELQARRVYAPAGLMVSSLNSRSVGTA